MNKNDFDALETPAVASRINQIMNCDGGQFYETLSPIRFKLPPQVDAEKLIYSMLKAWLKEYGEEVVWLPEYSEVARWLTDNHGKGLLLYGSCGQGKTLLAKHILPRIVHYYFRKVFRIVDAVDVDDEYKVLRQKRLIVIDDLGCEKRPSEYDKHFAIGELIDKLEKNKGICIITTNLDIYTDEVGNEVNEILDRYGDRVYDRIVGNFSCVHFTSNRSLR